MGYYRSERPSGIESEVKMEKELIARLEGEAKGIADALAAAAPEKRGEAVADYLARVREATENDEFRRQWHLLRVEGLDDETLMEAMEIVGTRPDYYGICEVESLIAGEISEDINEKVMIKGIQLLGKQGKITNIAWRMSWDDNLSPAARERMESSILEGIEVLLGDENDWERGDRQKSLQMISDDPNLSDKVKEAAKEALKTTEYLSMVRYALRGETFEDNVKVMELLAQETTDDAKCRAMELVVEGHPQEIAGLVWKGNESDVVTQKGIEMLAKHGFVRQLAVVYVSGKNIDRAKVEDALLEGIGVLAEKGGPKSERELWHLGETVNLSDRVRNATKAAFGKISPMDMPGFAKKADALKSKQKQRIK